MKDTENGIFMKISEMMTLYEWLRVILAFLQLVAMLGIPFVLYWLEKRDKNEDK